MSPSRPALLLLSVLSAAMLARPAPGQSPPAFPGAEGFGARTPGGRGGRVIVVRTLDDAGPGSLREAVEAKGPRIVVFAVGGLITLASSLQIVEPYLTIAGQTAPGDGICLRGHEVSIRTHDVVVRYLRFRAGDRSPADVDSLDIMGDAHDVIIDHCSATWSIDENLSPSGAVHDVTVQWCLMAEALNRSHHAKGEHGYGSLVRAVGGVTLHHNLWAHNIARNPRLGDNYGKPPFPTFDVRNNVIYDYGKLASGLTGDHLRVNYVANYVQAGPSSDRARGVIVFTPTAEASYFVGGNVVEHRPDWSADNRLLFDATEIEGRRLVTVVAKPFEAPPVRTTSAREARGEVLAGVGATRPSRDDVDRRIVASVEQGSGSIIDSQEQVGGWPVYRRGTPPADADADGMPDDWERAHGLDPRNPADASKAAGADGYTSIEAYLNEIAATATPPASVAADWALDSLTSIGGRAVTLVGSPRVVDTPLGKAIEFDGTGDALVLEVNPIAGLPRFTLEAVFEPAADGPAEQRFLHLSERASDSRAMMETRILPGGSWCLDTYLRHDPASQTLIDRTRLHPAGSWHAAALVYDGRAMRHYVDGVLEAEAPLAFSPIGVGRTSIGARQNQVGWFKGKIARLRVTPEALAPGRLLRPPDAMRRTPGSAGSEAAVVPAGPSVGSTWARGAEGQRKADLGDGTYLNPIMAGDHPDPSLLKDGDDYYMTFSSFDAYPGLVIWHSRDLVNWAPIGPSLFKNVGSVWAPDLVKHGGRYYVYFPGIGPRRSNYVIWANSIRGPWSEPIDLGIGRIDPGHAVGPDGRRYLFLSGGYLVELAPDGLSVVGTERKVYDGWKYPDDWIVEGFAQEGPKILRHGGYYHMVLAEGGTAGPPTGHMIVSARARSIDGPWENSPYNPVLRTRSASEPWWSKGHGTLVEGPGGQWYIVYHAYENGFYTLGRQTLLEPIEWTADGWFRTTGVDVGRPIRKPAGPAGPHGLSLSDDFSTNRMGVQWSFYKGTDTDRARYRYEKNGLVLKAKGTSPSDSSPLSFVTGDHAYEVEVRIDADPGATAGLLLFYSSRLYAGLGFSATSFVMHSYGLDRPQSKPAHVGRTLFIRIRNDRHIVTMQYSVDGKAWERYDRGMELSGYHHNVAYEFLSLRPALYAAGTGEVRFSAFKYRALE